MLTWPDQAEQAFREMTKRRLIPMAAQLPGPRLDRQAIEAILPHRAPFLFVDQVIGFDLEQQVIAACYELAGAQSIFDGHFPGRPIWPGVLQIEAISQAGIILCLKQANAVQPARVALTQVLGARFIRPVLPSGEVELLACMFEEGLFLTVVGQCLHHGQICSVAAVTILLEEDKYDSR